MEPLLYTIPQAMQRLSLGRTRIYSLIAAGRLRSVVIGSSRRIPASALHDFVSSLNDEPEDKPSPQ